MSNMEMNPEIKKEWKKFLEFIYATHQLTRDWSPDYYSIKLWEEYRKSKRK